MRVSVIMKKEKLTRWQQFYSEDPKLADIPPSVCADQAAKIFTENNCRIILDLGCGTGRDSLHLAKTGSRVIGLDAARSGLLLAQKRTVDSRARISWIESDSRELPFPDAVFDGVYCFGLLHEFVDELARDDVSRTLKEARRVLTPNGVAIITVSAGDPEKGLPHVQNFSEAMFDAATAKFHCVEKKLYDDLGCTGRKDYKIWFGYFAKG